MIKEWATVVSWEKGEAIVHCDIKSSCSGCASRTGCGTRVLNQLGPQPVHLLSVQSEQPLEAGQKVELGIAESRLLGSALLVYMLPLMGLFLCSGIFQGLFGTNLAAMCGACLGGVGGFLIARGVSQRVSGRAHWQPVILNVALGPDALRINSSTPSVKHE